MNFSVTAKTTRHAIGKIVQTFADSATFVMDLRTDRAANIAEESVAQKL
jgi:hypothetical protein